MKIIIPVDEASPNTGVCVSFGRAPYFALCEGEGVTFIENPGAQAEGGAGLKLSIDGLRDTVPRSWTEWSLPLARLN